MGSVKIYKELACAINKETKKKIGSIYADTIPLEYNLLFAIQLQRRPGHSRHPPPIQLTRFSTKGCVACENNLNRTLKCEFFVSHHQIIYLTCRVNLTLLIFVSVRVRLIFRLVSVLGCNLTLACRVWVELIFQKVKNIFSEEKKLYI